MRYVKIAGNPISVIGLGTWQIGTPSWGWGTEFGPSDIETILDTAQKVGINLIDTAELYGNGESELQLGLHLAKIDKRFLVASKISPWNLGSRGVQKAVSRSLQRLQVARIDFYQIHTPNPFIPLSKTMAGMRLLLEENKIHAVGVSNFSLKRWKQSERILGHPVWTNQVNYSLLHSKAFNSLKPMLDENHTMIAYSPLAMGLLSGKYSATHRPSDSRSKNPTFSARNFSKVQHVLQTLEKLAKKHDALVSQIALAWVIAHPNVIAIPGAKSVEQVRQNAEATEIDLSEEELAELDAVSSSYSPSLHIPRPFETFKWMLGVE